jgi:hypothetical protein
MSNAHTGGKAMDKNISYALQQLREYLEIGVKPGEAVMSAANEAQRKFGGSYYDIKQAIEFLQFGRVA